MPVRMRVLDFELPSTSSLRSAFPVDPNAACVAHTGSICDAADPKAGELQYLYGRAALENRVTIPDPLATGPGPPPAGGADSANFERYSLPLITGTTVAEEAAGCAPDPAAHEAGCLAPPRLAGAALTAVEAYGVSRDGETVGFGCADVGSSCLADWRGLARRHRFEDRFLLYVCDEPGAESAVLWPLCAQAAANVAASDWPEVPQLVTTWIQEALAFGGADFIDVITVGIDFIADKPDEDYAGDRVPAYDGFVSQPGKELWLYTACGSFGCDDDQGPAWDGWAGYAIDQPASQSRAVGWLTYLYSSLGELYYNTTVALPQAWEDQYRFGGNGDGTLFYPGLPKGPPEDADPGDEIEVGDAPAIGGEHEIPIESIRLKRIRDGARGLRVLEPGRRARGCRGGLLGGVRALPGVQRSWGRARLGHALRDFHPGRGRPGPVRARGADRSVGPRLHG